VPGLPRPAAHLMFTDGVAVVSVFIESQDPKADAKQSRMAGAPLGAAQIGAASAYTVVIEGHRVTAVGEVPPVTVKAIAETLRPGAGPSAQR